MTFDEHAGPVVDLPAAEKAAEALLRALGVDLDTAHLCGTPGRMARALHALLSPDAFEATTFDNADYDELVVVKDIRFHALCAHHALPFVGGVDIGYRPAARIIGLSKLARVVVFYSRQMQVQEQLTTQIADWLVDNLCPKAVGVRIRAEHLCMSMRGVQAAGAVTVTSAFRGDLASDPMLRNQWITSLTE